MLVNLAIGPVKMYRTPPYVPPDPGGNGRYSTSNATLAPPAAGTQGYSTMALPGIGNSYYDTTFTAEVRQLTNNGANTCLDYMYSFCWGNADGTLCWHVTPAGDEQAIYSSSGATYKSGLELGIGSEVHPMWDPNSSHIYYTFQAGGATTRGIWQCDLDSDTSTRIFDPGANCQVLGASQNWVDRNGNMFLYRTNGTTRVWSRNYNTSYTGFRIYNFASGAYTGISPDGNWIITHADPGKIVQQLDHANSTVGNSTMIWSTSRALDHAGIVSASNGSTYILTFDDNITMAYAVAMDGSSTALFNYGSQYIDASGVGKGEFQDWGIYSPYAPGDEFNDPVSEFSFAYRQEIIAVNVLTGEVRRYAHHRSRSYDGFNFHYASQPKVSCSWDGSYFFWCSNWNDPTPDEFAEVFAIVNPDLT